MRVDVCKKGMTFLERHPSGLFARIQLQILLQATAEAFGRKGKCILFAGDALGAYARFTKQCMEGPADRERLFRISFRLGRKIRRFTGLTDPEDLQRLVFLLYRQIGITMTGQIPGRLVVSECYFSRVYSSEQCRLISAMDAGIIAGICGRGRLRFTQRIMQGCECCRAEFRQRVHE